MVRHDGRRNAQKLKVEISKKLESSKKIKKNKVKVAQANEESSNESVKLPAIFIDIDGVILKGTGSAGVAIQVIEGSDKALKRVMTKKIPFALLTNGGLETEQNKTDKMNKLLNLTPESEGG